MRRLLIPIAIAGAIALATSILLQSGKDSGSEGRSRGGASGSAGRNSGSGVGSGGDHEFPPIASRAGDLPPNELLLDPPPIEAPPELDPRLALTGMPGATWVEIENWFLDRATNEERMQASSEFLKQLPRDDALDRLLTLASVVTAERGRAEYCGALATLLIPTVLDSREELTRFRRILTKGKKPSERFVALPIIQMAVRVNGDTQGVIEAYELAFYSVEDGDFAQVLMGEVGLVQSPTRSLRLLQAAVQRGKSEPGNGYFVAAILGAESILAAEKVARVKLASRELPPGSALMREYQMADRVDLRRTVIDAVYDAALDGERTEEEFLAALEFFRGVAPKRVDALRSACEQPELRARIGS